MTNLSALVGKPVLNISASRIEGFVYDVYFDEYLKTAVYFCITPTAINTVSKTLLLPCSEAQGIADAVVIADSTKLAYPLDVDLTSLHSGVLGREVFLPNGINKGKIADVLITNANKISKFKTETDEFTPSVIISIGDVLLLKSAVKQKPRKVTLPRPEKDSPVYILNDTAQVLEIEKTLREADANQEAVPAAAVQESLKPISFGAHSAEPVLSNGAFEVLLDGSQAYSYDEEAHTPTRIICDYEFLLGRTLGADLCTYTGELIAKQGSLVTDFIVEKARRAGKLVELTLNSVKQSK